ncbi:hypothetical protein DENSPDRAFT_839210 [Dentipellis sp. KUC8613]|nr:hypothetical protein DENSPDRAFT_839210 [Dentipellis sp. KUC8613]
MGLSPPQTYVHPEGRTTVLPHLLEYLPHSLNQENLINIPPSSSTTVLVSYPPSLPAPSSHPWAVGILDLSRPNETEFFFWCSEEKVHILDENEQAQAERFREAYGLLDSMISFIAETYPDKVSLFLGSLHASFVQFFPPDRIHRLSEPWAKLIFTPETLPPVTPASESLAARYIFEKIHDPDLDDVIATSTVQRQKPTLARLSSTGAYPTGSPTNAARAWCFTAVEGSVSTLYVRPEERGRGLGKIVMRQELEKGFKKRRFVSADVSLTNKQSAGVSASLGARKMWETVWMEVCLEGFRREQGTW